MHDPLLVKTAMVVINLNRNKKRIIQNIGF